MNVKKENNYNLTFIAIGFYLSLQIFSDIGSLKIIKLFGYSIDGGTFLYPFTFTIRDLIHRLSSQLQTLHATSEVNSRVQKFP